MIASHMIKLIKRLLVTTVITNSILISQVCYGHHKFVIIANAYNNKDYYKEHLDSLIQAYSNYRVIYCDDCSSDGSGHLAQKYIASLPNKHRFTFVQNTIRRGQLANTYSAIHEAQDDEIVVIVDADDKLVHNKVLAYLDYIYTKKNLWMTYGQFKFITDNKHDPRFNKPGFAVPYPPHIVKNRAFRHYPAYLLSHPRTYYVWLFKQIKLEDLLYNDYFYLAATDPATMYPMAEMAVDHLSALDRTLYAYRYHSNQTDIQKAMLHHIRQRKIYPKLQQPIYSSYQLKNSLACLLYAHNKSYQALENLIRNCIKQSTHTHGILNTLYIISSSLSKQEQEKLSSAFRNNTSLNTPIKWVTSLSQLNQFLRQDSAHYLWILPSNLESNQQSLHLNINRCIKYLQSTYAAGFIITHHRQSVPLDSQRRALAPGIYCADQNLFIQSTENHSFIFPKKLYAQQKFISLANGQILQEALKNYKQQPSTPLWLYYSSAQAQKNNFS